LYVFTAQARPTEHVGVIWIHHDGDGAFSNMNIIASRVRHHERDYVKQILHRSGIVSISGEESGMWSFSSSDDHGTLFGVVTKSGVQTRERAVLFILSDAVSEFPGMPVQSHVGGTRAGASNIDHGEPKGTPN
jgi:hypothetical protein